MELDAHRRLVEKLARIEGLFADRGATPDLKTAAGEARERITRRLQETNCRFQVHPRFQ